MVERLRLYAIYKQALCGDAGPSPSLSSGVIEVTKHQNWALWRGTSSVEARRQYVAQVDEILGTRWRGDRSSPSPQPFSSVGGVGAADAELDRSSNEPEVESLRRQIAQLQARVLALDRHERCVLPV